MTARLRSIHHKQIDRDPWPRYDAFDTALYPIELRRHAAGVWARRAREEHKSVLEFSMLLRTACILDLLVEVLGSLARLITDEVRHVVLCEEMAKTCLPEDPPGRERGVTTWPEPPPRDAPEQALVQWAADGVITSCCLGEELSRPLYEASATVTTDPVCEEVLRQILRDEHLHATFGWELMTLLMDRATTETRAQLQSRLAITLTGYERTCSAGLRIEDLAGTEVVIERGEEPNLGMLSPRQYATVFFATLEAEVFPKLASIGLDPHRAWRERPRG